MNVVSLYSEAVQLNCAREDGLLKASCGQGSLTWFFQEELKMTGTKVTIHLNHVFFNVINAIVISAAYERSKLIFRGCAIELC